MSKKNAQWRPGLTAGRQRELDRFAALFVRAQADDAGAWRQLFAEQQWELRHWRERAVAAEARLREIAKVTKN